jgi:hypothetical protein
MFGEGKAVVLGSRVVDTEEEAHECFEFRSVWALGDRNMKLTKVSMFHTTMGRAKYSLC